MRILLLFFILFVPKCYSQEEMILQFSKDLFDTQINSEALVEKYIVLDSLDSDLTISERRSAVIEHVKEIRLNRNKEQGWLMPRGDWNTHKLTIMPYRKAKHLDTLKLNSIEKVQGSIFVITDADQKEILQYFLLDEQNKILSFSLFVKGDLAWFFGY